jgi:AhpD family alkylhydroperoxidase
VTTIRLPRDEDASGRLREVLDVIRLRQGRVSNLWRAMAHQPAYLEANWQRVRAIMLQGKLPHLTKEFVAVGVAVANLCQYCIDAHVAAVMRRGIGEVGVTELLGVVEHTHGLARLIAALLIEPDLYQELPPGNATLIGLPHGDELDAETRQILAEIRVVEAELVGVDRVPNLWRAMAPNAAYLKATWDKHRLVMAPGELSEQEKQIVALGVAMNAGSRYLIERLSRTLLRAGRTRADILEIAAVVDHLDCLTRIAGGMQLDSDVVAPGNSGASAPRPRS